MPRIDIRGVSHAYDLTEPTRSPDTLVWVHGWLLSRTYWQPLIDLLAPDYRCLSYDMRGFGDSQWERCEAGESLCQDYRLVAYAEDLVLLLKQLGIERAWLIGHSFGGSVALWAADLLPEQVKGVICLNAGGGIYLKEEFEKFREAGRQLVRLRPRWLTYVPLLDHVFARASVARAIDLKWGRQRLVDFVTAHPEAAIGTLLESTTEAEVHLLPQVVARLQQPIYFIAGAQDRIMEPKYVRHLASFHPLFEGYGANVTELDDCGHLAMVEQPQAVANVIQEIVGSAS